MRKAFILDMAEESLTFLPLEAQKTLCLTRKKVNVHIDITTAVHFTFFYCFQGIARLQRQQQIVDEVKLALKPFFRRGEITKDGYKLIMKKSVEKVGCFFRFPRYMFSNQFKIN